MNMNMNMNMKKIILSVFAFSLFLPTLAFASLNPAIKLPSGDWDNPNDYTHILTTGRQQVANFYISSSISTTAWRQILLHVSMTPGLTASNWEIQDASNTAYTSSVSAVQNGDIVTFTSPQDLPIYNTISSVHYLVYAVISGDIKPTSKTL